MRALVSDVVVDQHRSVLFALDALGKHSLPAQKLVVAYRTLAAHMSAEQSVLHALELPAVTLRQGDEEHAVLQFAMDRLVVASGSKDRATREARLRSFRDLAIHHFDHEERVVLPALESIVGPRASRRLAKRLEARFRELTSIDA
jgi:hypothetical protein